ncbi:MAG: ATP-binding cassette domain-containing protein, partial [Oscillospiraceae bacterium]|nr:ATP-binding cassette domain-containing protein [Oscillospiraceae bacterium]
MTLIELKDVTKKFGEKTVINKLTLQIEAGKSYAAVGRSGCGKSTLLNIMGGIERATSGNVKTLGSENISPYSRRARHLLRYHISFLFQNYALSDNDTVEYNLKMALLYNKEVKNKEKAISTVLSRVGMEGFEKNKIYTLSGGEQQRVAMARLLLKPTQIALADEPTANLDTINRDVIIKLLMELNEEGKTVILATHDFDLAKNCSVI